MELNRYSSVGTKSVVFCLGNTEMKSVFRISQSLLAK